MQQGLFAMRLQTGKEGAGSDGSIVVRRLRTHDLDTSGGSRSLIV